MIKLLTESISIMLDAAFGGDYTIYQESIEQDLKEPCFLFSVWKLVTTFSGESGISANIKCVSNTSPFHETIQKLNVKPLPNSFIPCWNV